MQVGQRCESYQLQVRLKQRELALAGKVQEMVEGARSGGLIRLPPHSLHMTVLPLLDVDEHLGRPPREIWAEHGTRWMTAIAEQLVAWRPFTVELPRIAFLSRAVVLVGESPQLHIVRETLAPVCGLPERPPRIPQIAHVSLFRYIDAAPNPLPVDRPTTFTLVVDRIRLVREEVYPSLEVTSMADFPVGTGE